MRVKLFETNVMYVAVPILAAVLALSVGTPCLADSSTPAPTIPALPPSLAAHYPPAAAEPVHLLAMLGLQDALTGIVVDLFEGDDAGARAGGAEFAAKYGQAAALVPEWRSAYPEAPVQTLRAALDTGDRPATMSALDAMGAVCHSCHLVTMAPVQHAFRWGSFAEQSVADPLAGDTPAYQEFKRRLATNLTGITHDLQQGQVDNARHQFAAFRDRFDALTETCLTCHATPRRSFVDPEVMGMISDLDRALAVTAPDPGAVAGIARNLGRASCSGCHLVHVPAALAQASGHATAVAVR